jgi:hypothetical protein
MEPVRYEVKQEDIDEVLDAYEPTGGGRFQEDERKEIRAHVMRNVLDIDEIVRGTPETEGLASAHADAQRAGPVGERPGDQSSDRRETALAAIEDLLIRDGYLDLDADESRAFPATGEHDTERSA